jgi:L-fucose isomerase-like protein
MGNGVTFGVIVSTRDFFPDWLAAEGRKQFLEKLDGMGYDYVIPAADATPNGAIETYEDACKCARLFREKQDEIDGIIVVLPNFGDEQGVTQTIDMADLGLPVLVQACDDDLDKLDLEHRRDAFCGKLSVCNNLYQHGIKFTNTTLHSCPIDSDEFTADIEFFARVCRVVSGVSGARLGAIGQRPDPFHTVRFSEKLLQASGITVSVVDLSEILFAALNMEDDQQVEERIAKIHDYGRVPEEIPEKSVRKAARLALAIDAWVEANDVDATAIQCWSSVQENYGCGTCFAMSMMGEEGKPSACETDVMGALTMYALHLATGEPSGYLDWNNNYADERDKCICVHCSNYPKGFLGVEPEVSTLDILGASLGADRCFGAVKGRVAPGPMTYAKISTDDVNGRVRFYVGEGEFTDDPAETVGGVAVCKVPELQGLMDYICSEGYEHHVAMNRGHSARVLVEALGKYLGWNFHHHAPGGA